MPACPPTTFAHTTCVAGASLALDARCPPRRPATDSRRRPNPCHACCVAKSDILTTPASLAGATSDVATDEPSPACRLHLRFGTYNTLSLHSHLQQQALASLFNKQGCHVVGLQETRLPTDGVATYAPYTAFCAAGDNGTEGVQLWVNFGRAATPADCTVPLYFQRDSFCIRHSEPRLLLVTGCLGDIRLVFVVAHALTSTHSDEEISAWWAHVDECLKRVPRGFCPVFLLHANARYTMPCHNTSASAAEALNTNGECLQDLSQSHGIHLSALQDADGNAVVSWVSPTGHRVCLDFIGLPTAWGSQMRTENAPPTFVDQFAGIDHSPVFVEIHVDLHLRVRPTHRLPDARFLRTPHSQQILRQLWETVPLVPWHVDVDSHLAVINRHLAQGLAQAFKHTPRASHPALSAYSWHLLHEQRRTRRLLTRRKQYWQKEALALALYRWRHGSCTPQTMASRHRVQQAWHRVQQTIQHLRECRRSLRAQSQLDKAEFTRAMFAAARDKAELPHLLRSIERTGRRYKAPPLLPNMPDACGGAVATRQDFMVHAGRHFATAERARTCSLADMPAVYRGHRSTQAVQLQDLPTLEELARSFGRLKTGRAPGITGLIPEVYIHCPDLAAASHFPLVIKGIASGTYPLLWMGGAAVPIPKPAKSPSAMSGWRSILLQECSGKAVSSALRDRLLQGLECQAPPPGMAGARKGVPLRLPCHLVGRYLDLLRETGQSGAVLFVDGEAALYSTVRCFIDPHHGDFTLDAWIDSLHEDVYLTDRIKAMLRTHDVLEAGRIAHDVQDALRGSLCVTWYTALPTHQEIYQSVTGTVPGAPLADLLFQLTFAMCMSKLTGLLEEQGICARLAPSRPAAAPECAHPTWMDDVALLLRAPCCTDVAPALVHAAGAMQSMLRTTGISMNLLPGKTEGLAILHGSGSRAEKHRLFAELNGLLPFGRSNESVLCLTDSYVHLGVLLGSQCLARKHIDRRARLAELSFLPLRRRLLPNPCLSTAEKRKLFRSFALSRLLHGIEQWTLESDKDCKSFHGAYMGLVRRCIRPIVPHA